MPAMYAAWLQGWPLSNSFTPEVHGHVNMQDESDDEDEGDKIGSFFKQAKAVGAQQGTADDLPTQAAFAGHGRTLAGSSGQV